MLDLFGVLHPFSCLVWTYNYNHTSSLCAFKCQDLRVFHNSLKFELNFLLYFVAEIQCRQLVVFETQFGHVFSKFAFDPTAFFCRGGPSPQNRAY